MASAGGGRLANLFRARPTSHRRERSTGKDPEKSIAVLPFENLSDEKQNDISPMAYRTNPDAPGQGGRPESYLAHFDAALQERA